MLKIIYTLLFVLSFSAHAEENSVIRTDDAYASGEFLQYKPYIKSAPKSDKKPASPPPPKAEAKPESKEEEVTIEWLKKNYEVLQLRSMNNPTPENVLAEATVRRIAFDKAQNYATALVNATKSDPYLDENNRVPYASTGGLTIRNADIEGQQNAVREMAANGGLIVFVDGSCRFCAMQMPLITFLKKSYGLEALVVSLDGNAPSGYKGQIIKDNGLYRKLSLKLTPSIVYVHKPKAYLNGMDKNEYSIVSQGFFALDELTKQIAYAGYRRNYLSADVKKDLDVWKRGVATTEDLNNLKLDVNNPKAIHEKVGPLLGKRYD